jgi:hypothetical protein
MAPVGSAASVVTSSLVTMHHGVLCSLLVAFLGMVHATLLDHQPGARTASTSQSALQPFIGKAIESQLDKRNTNPLAGLLEFKVRSAAACPSGYGQCKNNPSKCCPIGGACCTNNCCKSGFFCYSSGSAIRSAYHY